jgi:hypothetical protein
MRALQSPPVTLRTLALECVQRITRDLTHPAFPPGMSPEVETTRYGALIDWASTGQRIAAGEWDNSRLHDFVQECQARFDCCEDITALP